MKIKLSIIIPVFNEEKTILEILKKIKESLSDENSYEVIVVDDGSRDNSLKLLENNKSLLNKLIINDKNKGKGYAVIKGIEASEGKYIAFQDADLEYDPKDYKKLIKPIVLGQTSVVYGSRVLKKKRYNSKSFISLYRIFFNHMLTILSNTLNNQKLTDAHTCYKVFDAKLFKNLELKEDDFAFCPEVTSKVSRLNVNIIERKISYKGRTSSEGKKIGIIDGFRAIYVLIKLKIFN